MTIGLFGVIISLAIAMLIGGIAGFFGGALDFFLMRVIEVIIAVPGLYLLIALRGLFPLRTSSITVYFLLVIVLACIGWAANARVIRGLVLSIRERDYVIAARVLGVSNCGIIIKHILPNTYSYIIIAATLSVPYYILGEISLSFLGLGISEPYASWGNMLTSAQNIQYLSLYPWILTPGIFIFITILAFNFLGDGLRDALDPKE